MIFFTYTKSKAHRRVQLQSTYMRPIMFLWALTEDAVSDHRSCQGDQGTAAQACSEGWAHGHRGSSCGAGACVSCCIRKWSLLFGRGLLQA